MPKKKVKVVFADTTAVDGLSGYVVDILVALAKVTKKPGIAEAFVSDQSSISDFFDSREEIGKTGTLPKVTADTPANRKLVAALSKELGVEVGIYDYVYKVAIKMRDA